MKPFASVTDAIAWWNGAAKFQAVGVLIDFTSLDEPTAPREPASSRRPALAELRRDVYGVQRRETFRQRNGQWILGFPQAARQ